MGDRRKYLTRREQNLQFPQPCKGVDRAEGRSTDYHQTNAEGLENFKSHPMSIVATEVAPANKKSTPAKISGEQSFRSSLKALIISTTIFT